MLADMLEARLRSCSLFTWASACLPATNYSWVGKAHLFRQPVERTEVVVHGRPWTLLTATPASCVNIGLFHVHQAGEPIDLVISGPNLGRNSGRYGVGMSHMKRTSATRALHGWGLTGPQLGASLSIGRAAACMWVDGSNFTTSSGTIGAALEAALCGVRSVALSFAFFKDEHYDAQDIATASRIACRVIGQLWQTWPADVQIFNVNVPLCRGITDDMDVHLTHIHVNESASMFRPEDDSMKTFKFAPDFGRLLGQTATHGSDNWAVHGRVVSVTPLRAAYAEVPWPESPFPRAPEQSNEDAEVQL